MTVARTLGVLVMIGVLGVPFLAWAAEFRAGKDSALVASQETINDDLYIASGEVRIEGNVHGDVVVAGGQVMIDGTVDGDVAAVGGQITIRGTVHDDVRVAGGDVMVAGNVNDDVILAGGNLLIDKMATVTGEVRAVGGQLTIAGKTGSVWAGVGSLKLAPTADVKGNLTYSSDDQAQMEPGSHVGGTVTYHQTHAKEKSERAAWMLTAGSVVSLLVSIVMGLLVLYVLPKKSVAVINNWRKDIGLNLLWGILFLIATPIMAILLLISIIGFPVGIGMLLVYPIMLYLGKLVTMIAIGVWVQRWWRKDTELSPDWLSVLFGALVWWILWLIPFIGWAVVSLMFLVGVGALVRFDWQMYQRLRREQVF
jgi:cytoskeletal protein CcmA (bactofilin family)